MSGGKLLVSHWGSVSGGRWGCGAIAWSGGGAVSVGWCVAVAPCCVPGDGGCGSVSGGVACGGSGICGIGTGGECPWNVGWSRERQQES